MLSYGDMEQSAEAIRSFRMARRGVCQVLQAQAEMKQAAEAAEKLSGGLDLSLRGRFAAELRRSELNQKKNNVSTMLMIRSKS